MLCSWPRVIHVLHDPQADVNDLVFLHYETILGYSCFDCGHVEHPLGFLEHVEDQCFIRFKKYLEKGKMRPANAEYDERKYEFVFEGKMLVFPGACAMTCRQVANLKNANCTFVHQTGL